MLDIKSFLIELSQKGIQIHVDNEKLKTRNPPGSITAEIGAKIKQNKQRLIEFLQHEQQQRQGAVVSYSKAPRSNQMLLSSAQRRFWMLQQLAPHSSQHHIYEALSLEGDVNPEALSQAFKYLVDTHEILRTQYVMEKQNVYQCVLEDNLVDFHYETHVPEAEVTQKIHEAIEKPFDLSSGRVVRGFLLGVAQSQFILVFVVHHIAADGLSLNTLIEQFSSAYDSLVSERPLPQPNNSVMQYIDFAQWQQSNAYQNGLVKDQQFWQRTLSGAPNHLLLPVDHLAGSPASDEGDVVSFTLSKERSDELQLWASAHNSSIFVALMAALNALLFKWTGESDIVVGTVVSGRPSQNEKSMVGCFINTLLVRNGVDGDLTSQALFEQVKSNTNDALAHQYYPFEYIAEMSQQQRKMHGTPFMNVALLLQDYQLSETELTGVNICPLDLTHNSALLDLRFVVRKVEKRYSIRCEYRTGCFEKETIEALLSSYSDLIPQLIEQSQPLHKITLNEALVAQQDRYMMRHPDVDLVSTFVAEPIEKSLLCFASKANKQPRLHFYPYNQVMQYLYDIPNGQSILLIRLEDWCHQEDVSGSLHDAIEAFTSALMHRNSHSNAACYIIFCPYSNSAHNDLKLRSVLDSGANAIKAAVARTKHIHICPRSYFSAYGLPAKVNDEVSFEAGKVPYTDETYHLLGMLAVRMLSRDWQPQIKVLVLDCDNTLWRGVCGEMGPLGIQVTPSHQRWQHYLKAQLQLGYILCICSKNNEEAVQGVFAENDQMVLKYEDFAVKKVNWESKSSNLINLAKTLNLSLSSFVFIDDDPVQCNEVMTVLPQVTTIKMPTEEAIIDSLPLHLWPLDRAPSLSAFSESRTAFYIQNEKRDSIKAQSASVNDFIETLKLQVAISPVTIKSDIHRLSELSLRTNQFTLNTARYDYHTLFERIQSGELSGIEVNVSDRYGEYGIVGLVLYTASSESILIEAFMLSCRAMGRTVEQKMLQYVANLEAGKACSQISLHYRNSGKNVPAKNFVEQIIDQSLTGIGDKQVVITQQQAAQCSANVEAPTKTHEVGKTPANYPASDFLTSMATHYTSIMRVVSEFGETTQSPVNSASFLQVKEVIKKIWLQVLNTNEVDETKDFFQNGGHSLLAVRVISALHHACGVTLKIGDIFEASTLQEMTKFVVEKMSANTEQVEHITMLPRQIHGRYGVLSSAQQRMWFMAQIEQQKSQYNIPMAFIVEGAVHLPDVVRALNLIIQRHEILRTTYLHQDGKVVQVISPTAAVNIAYDDLVQWSDVDEQSERVKRLVTEYANKPFDIANDLMFRCNILRLASDKAVVVFTMHHIASDGWTIGLLVKEFLTIYGALQKGHTVPLAEHKLQYLDYANWQQSEAQQNAQEKQLAFWASQLNGAPQLHNLPLCYERPKQQDYTGACFVSYAPAQTRQVLETFANSHNVTLFMLLQTIFAALISRWSYAQDIVIGSPVSGREHPDLDEMMGFFVNTVALRTYFEPQQTVCDLLEKNRTTITDAFINQQVPFDRVVEALKPERSMDHAPLFQILFVLQNNARTEFDLDGLTFSAMVAEHQASKFDLELEVQLNESGLVLNWRYATSLFSAQFIVSLADSFDVLLDEFIARPDAQVNQLCLTRTNYVSDECDIALAHNECGQLSLNDKFESTVQRYPDATAVSFFEQQLSYSELNRQANQLANLLLSRGVKANETVVIYLPRSIEMVVAVLAVLKAGAAYLPIDVTLPSKRIAQLLQDAKSTHAISLTHYTQKVSVFSPIYLDTDTQLLAEQSDLKPGLNVNPEYLAYVLYTSGSTGLPKGIGMPHRALVNLIEGMIVDQPGLARRHIFIQFASIGFDMSFTDMFLSFVTGGQLVLIDQATQKDVDKLAEQLFINQVSTVNLPYVMLHHLAEHCLHTGRTLPALQFIISTAEKLVITQSIRQFFIEHRNCALINHYGPTETHVVTSTTLSKEVSAWPTVPPIGSPLKNVQCYLLGPDLRPVPNGAIGELYIGGAALAKGYINSPELTAKRFLEPTKLNALPQRLYYTGDLVRYLPSGELEYVGRVDEQVKLRGYRIELGAVESQLDALEHVMACAAMVKTINESEYLVAFIHVDELVLPHNSKTANMLRRQLKESLPEYMVPSYLYFVNELPLTANGKVDKKQLLTSTPDIAHETYIAATTESQKHLKAIWETLLNQPQVSADANFFAVGGHSLLVVKLIAEIKNIFDLELEVQDVFEHEVLVELANFIDSKKLAQSLNVTSDTLEAGETEITI